MTIADTKILLLGGGDLASGVACRFFRAGFPVLIVEKEEPLAVRREVAFASAVYRGNMTVEDIEAKLVTDGKECGEVQGEGYIAVTTCENYRNFSPKYNKRVLIDARMFKERPDDIDRDLADLVIGLGPGFSAGDNVDVVVETSRDHYLGRAIYQGEPAAYTGRPGSILGLSEERVIHAEDDGLFSSGRSIGEHIRRGERLGELAGGSIEAPIGGVIRGLLKPGLQVKAGTKLADIDPRGEEEYAFHISDKALAVGGGALEAVLHCLDIN